MPHALKHRNNSVKLMMSTQKAFWSKLKIHKNPLSAWRVWVGLIQSFVLSIAKYREWEDLKEKQSNLTLKWYGETDLCPLTRESALLSLQHSHRSKSARWWAGNSRSLTFCMFSSVFERRRPVGNLLRSPTCCCALPPYFSSAHLQACVPP